MWTGAIAAVLAGSVLASLAGCSSSGPAATSSADNAAACAGARSIIKQLDSISTDLAASKRLFGQLSSESASLVDTAPPSLKGDAGALADAISASKKYVDQARTIEQLQGLEQRPAVQDAFNRLLTAGGKLGDWRTKHC